MDGVRVVLRRRRRRREVHRVAHVPADEDAVVDVHLAKLEVRVRLQWAQVFRRARDEVVEGKYPAAAVEQRRAEMRTDESGPAGDYRSGFIRGQRRGR